MGRVITLTDEQWAAVEAPEGPLLILAGPGTGKTAVLVARVAYLVRVRQVPPDRVLVVTFAARAAQELRQRLCHFLGPSGQGVPVHTLHALGLQLVHRWSDLLGYGQTPPTVLDARRAEELLRSAAEEVGLDRERFPLPLLAPLVERARLDPDGLARPESVATVVRRYRLLLRERHVVDYTALLELPLALFRACPRALTQAQEGFDCVLCDEAQDLQPAQYTLVRLLAQRHRRLTMVGDPLQQLYGWRGADGRCFAQFLRDYPEATVVPLQENFRSSGHIVALANALTGVVEVPARLWTRQERGSPVRVVAARDPVDEALAVVRQVQRLVATDALTSLGEVAVLARTKAQLAAVATAMRRQRLPWRFAGREDTRATWLSTIHQAKGREWPIVFVIGWEEGLLPHAAALALPADPSALLHEWCVAYVAVTRARERLYLSYCQHRQVGGQLRPRQPSRFLAALPSVVTDLAA